MMVGSYIRLMRLNRPIGIWLLWAPTAWALWLANRGMPNVRLLVYFMLGTVIMRSAGCVVNDLCDRNFDAKVARTQKRPLASGELKPLSAFVILFILLWIGLLIVWQLPLLCFAQAICAVLITFIYPLCKRFMRGPQLVLSIAFSIG